MKNASATLEQVIHEVDDALKDSKSIHSIYLNLQGEVDMASVAIQDLGDGPTPDDYDLLRDEISSPSFEICSVGGGGEILTALGKVVRTGDNAALQEALENAVSERQRFYSERAAEHGPTAWPRV